MELHGTALAAAIAYAEGQRWLADKVTFGSVQVIGELTRRHQ
jgi:hypothetical protein